MIKCVAETMAYLTAEATIAASEKAAKLNVARPCRIVQWSDQEGCLICGLLWDMNDPSPPICKGEPE